MISQSIRFGLNLASAMVMARLLLPVEYGLVAMVMPVTGFVGLFKDLGLSTATVQKEQINHDQVSVLFWINVVASAILMVLCLGISPLVGRFYHDVRTTWITMALAGTFVLSGLAAQHSALLRRQMRFGVIARIDVFTAVTSALTGILTAWLSWGYWSLVAMTIMSNLANCAAVWVTSPWRPGRLRKGSGVREMIRFGGCLTISNICGFISNNIDKLIIGKVLGAAALGIYNRAFQLLLMPLDQMFSPVSSVLLTALSRAAGDSERYRKAMRIIGDLLLMLVTPLAAILLALAEETVSVFLGPTWMETVPIFRALAMVAAVLPMSYLGGIILQSSGRADVMMKWAPVTMGISVFSILAGMPWGLIGIASAWAIGAVAVRTPLFYLILSRTTAVTFRDLMYPVLFYAIPFAAIVLAGIRLRVVVHFTSPFLTLLVDGAALATGYGAFLFLTGKHRVILEVLRRSRENVFTAKRAEVKTP